MKKILFNIIIIMLLMMASCSSFQYCNMEAFTHPINLDSIMTYYKPKKFYANLSPDSEAGWIIVIKGKKEDCFLVNLPEENPLKEKSVWVKAGDIGVVIQNYDSIKIPLYTSNERLSQPIKYFYASVVGQILDIKDDMVLLKVTLTNGEAFKGWVERRYLCGNPYTTCN